MKNSKKILLVTLQDDNNLGNRLQNYALQRKIEEFGYTVYDTYYKSHKVVLASTLKSKFKRLVKIFLALFGNEKWRTYFVIEKHTDDRIRKFHVFSESFAPNRILVDPDSLNQSLTDSMNKFDYAITGSDQVWHNWHHTQNDLPYYYLEFMPQVKRISYAASYGFSSFPEADSLLHHEGLEGFLEQNLSVREEKGATLIKESTGLKATVVPDPTILLTADEWALIERRPRYKVANHFMVIYFLGNKLKSVKDKYKEIAKKYRLQIIDIRGINPDYYLTDPSEFVWLMRRADYVATDSFHATVFSILFHKNFFVSKREQCGFEDMFDRIDGLLKTTSLEDHEFGKYQKPVDWDKVDIAIREQAQIGIHFLERHLK